MDYGQPSVAITKCFACGKDNLTEVLNLGDQPLANSYLSSPIEWEETYPLRLNFCPDCTHLQLSHSVNPDLLFKDYLYVSGTSVTGAEHFKNFVQFTEKYTTGKNVLDVACNDGTQLKFYKDQGYNTYGIDPALNLLERSSQHGNIIADYLTAENIASFGVKFDSIIVQNVLAHVPEPEEFLKICKSALSENGCIFVQTSQANMIANNEFDTVYHEHLSFFSVESFCALAKRCGLNVIDVIRKPIHGTSFVFVLSTIAKDLSSYFIGLEKKLTLETLGAYSLNATKIAKNMQRVVELYREGGYTVVG